MYQLSTGGATIPVAVTVPAEAADVRTVDESAVRAALGGAELTFSDDQPPAIGASAAGGAASLDQGWNVMVLVLILAAGEAFLAMRFGHHRRA